MISLGEVGYICQMNSNSGGIVLFYYILGVCFNHLTFSKDVAVTDFVGGEELRGSFG